MFKKTSLKFSFLSLVLALILLLVISQAAFAEDWDAKFAAEWQAMGLTAAPEILPAPGGENTPFPYSIITPATADRPDDESMVFVLMADGFTDSVADQAKWRYYSQYFARVLLNYKPFEEFTDTIKVYRIDVVSNASGVTRSDSPDGRNMADDPKDTYFGGYLWNMNMARLGGVSRSAAATAMANAYVPTNTGSSKNVLLNTTVYGGSGGSLAFSTLSWAFIDLVVHEMTHEAANLPDEYLSSGSTQRNNAYNSFSAYSTIVHRRWIDDPAWQEWSPWYRLLGKNGTTFNAFTEALTTNADYANVFRASHNCKMRFLGYSAMYDETGEEEFGFCEVCKEAWRDRMCLISKTPVLHFQPYNDQFYDNEPVLLADKNFILRIPVGDTLTPTRHCQKVYGEEIDATTAVKGVLGEFKMTVYKDGVALPEYTDVPADTPMNLTAGTYTVTASFAGTYNGEAYSLNLASVENEFEVQPQTIVTAVGKYAEPWNSTDKTDTLTREWREDTPVMLPELALDPSRVGGTEVGQFDITYTWHVRNFDGSRGAQIGALGTYPAAPANGPSATGQYVLAVHSQAKDGAPSIIENYSVTNEYPFDITTPFHAANHYTVNAGTYTHESVSNDFRGITIVGEGFTEAEQDKFEAAAEEFITQFLDTDPVKRVAERFCFFIENTMSADSGIRREGGTPLDTYYGFQLNTDGSLGTYRTDMPMDMVIFNDVWRRDTNMKTWAQWGATVVLVNEENVQANYNWRHPESNRSAHLATIHDTGYTRLIESLVTQFAHVRSNREEDLLDTYRWMEGPEQNKTFEETFARLVESCYSHEMYGSGITNLPRPVIVSDAATKLYLTNGTTVLNWDVPDTFKAYSYGHELTTNTVAADSFTYRYYEDDGHRVGALLDSAPVEPGFYWAEADLPTGAKYYLDTDTDRYGFTYEAGTSLQGRNGTGTANSARVRGFVRFEIAAADITLTADNTQFQGLAASYPYLGMAVTPDFTLQCDGSSLRAGVDYELSYTANTAVGTATVTAQGIGYYNGEVSATFEITAAEPKAALNAPAVVYIDGDRYLEYTFTVAEIAQGSSFTFELKVDHGLLEIADLEPIIYQEQCQVGLFDYDADNGILLIKVQMDGQGLDVRTAEEVQLVGVLFKLKDWVGNEQVDTPLEAKLLSTPEIWLFDEDRVTYEANTTVLRAKATTKISKSILQFDLNENGRFDQGDIDMIIDRYYLYTDNDPEWTEAYFYDLDDSGRVDAGDLLLFYAMLRNQG